MVMAEILVIISRSPLWPWPWYSPFQGKEKTKILITAKPLKVQNRFDDLFWRGGRGRNVGDLSRVFDLDLGNNFHSFCSCWPKKLGFWTVASKQGEISAWPTSTLLYTIQLRASLTLSMATTTNVAHFMTLPG